MNYHKKIILMLLFLLTGYQLIAQASTRNIVVYFPEWGIYEGHNNYFPEHIPFNKITHINYAFLEIVKENGNSFHLNIIDTWASLEITDDWSYGPERTGCINRLSYQRDNFYPHVKLLFSVGGWSRCGFFSEMAATQAGRDSFTASCIDYLRLYNYDGIDIDWEYPGVERAPSNSPPGDQGNPVPGDDFNNFTYLMADLRAALDTAGTLDGKDYLLTIAASCGYDKIDLTDPGTYSGYLDFINVMTYDIHGSWDVKTNHQSPLYSNPYDPSATSPVNIKERYNSDYAMNYFHTKGVQADKLNMGIPYYGRGWKGISPAGDHGLFASHGGAADTGIWYGFSAPYYQQKLWADGADGFAIYRDPHAQVPWLYSPSTAVMWTFEDVISVQNKCSYVMDKGFGGVIIWDITGDYPSKPGRDGIKGSELSNAIYQIFKDPYYTQAPTLPPTPTPTGYPAWSASGIYTEGDLVSHKGNKWRAKWWTQNEEPGTADVWEAESSLPPGNTKGDANGDGTVDIIDALITAQFCVGLVPTTFDQNAADVNCDGTIDIVDSLIIARYYVGLLESFSGC